MQQELFPLDRLDPEPATLPFLPPKAHKTDALTPHEDPVADEEPDVEAVADNEPPAAPLGPEPAETDLDGAASLRAPTDGEYSAATEMVSVADSRRIFSPGTFVAGMSALSLLLATIALGVGIHASRTTSQRANPAEEDAVLARLAGLAAGINPTSVAVDGSHKRLQARAVRIPGAELSTYQALEQRVQAEAPGWTVTITPPPQPFPAIRFADGEDNLSASAKLAVQASAWAARRWGFATVGVPGLIAPQPARPLLPQRRAQAVLSLLEGVGMRATSLPAEGPSFRLHMPWPQQK